MDRLLAISDAVNAVLGKIATAAGWLFLVCTAVIVFDVLSRKFGFQVPGMGSTRLQELEWQLHTAIFCFWLGFAYIRNAHVRIDIAVAQAKPRTRALIELAGCLGFAIPVLPDRHLLQPRLHLDRLRRQRVVAVGERTALAVDPQELRLARPAPAAGGSDLGADAIDRLSVRAGASARSQHYRRDSGQLRAYRWTGSSITCR